MTEAFSGLGLGLLVGLLLGLSSASIVGLVASALTAGLAAFLGLAKSAGPDRAIRIGCFGLSCAIAGIGGLALRSGDWLAPSIRAQVRQWTDAGYSPDDAQSLVAYERLGVRPPGKTVGPAPVSANAFYATPTSLCGELDRLTDDATLTVLRSKASDVGRVILAAYGAAAPGEKAGVLHASVSALCD